ncbi:MAG TPA: hypothetical protein VFF03_02005 [Rhodocyclaceae bacterium]|nr:hypothetical protein [Rhodocyclaceae bacterium]
MEFRGEAITISASWPTPLGEYSVHVSSVSLPTALLHEQGLIQELIVEALSAFCAEDYKKDFSPKPFAYTVDLAQVSWMEL